MKKIAQLLTKYIVSKGIVAEAEAAVYVYGFQMGLELTVNLIVSIVIAIILKMLPEATIFFVIFIPIRSYAGGFHFDDYLRCFLLSVATYVAVLLLSGYVAIPAWILALVNVILLVAIRLLFPVQNVRRILGEEEIHYFAKKLHWILGIDMLFNFALWGWNFVSLLRVICLTLMLIVVTMVLGKVKYWWMSRKS